MHDEILYERLLPEGPAVRIRRTSEPGLTPVTAVLEVERRIKRAVAGGNPPRLMTASGDSEAEVVAYLEPHVREDHAVVQLMRDVGLFGDHPPE